VAIFSWIHPHPLPWALYLWH